MDASFRQDLRIAFKMWGFQSQLLCIFAFSFWWPLELIGQLMFYCVRLALVQRSTGWRKQLAGNIGEHNFGESLLRHGIRFGNGIGCLIVIRF